MITILKLIAAIFAWVFFGFLVNNEISKDGLQLGISLGFGLVCGLLTLIYIDKKF
jgi:hypothetical protein